jgi:putative ABC transport system permease protein
MNLREIFRVSIHGLSVNRLRSGLTTLGILIGVGAVILLVAVGNGSSKAIAASLSSLGTNTLTVRSGGTGFGPRTSGPQSNSYPLTVQDADALVDPTTAPDVLSSSPVDTTSAEATYNGASTDISSIVGTYPSYFQADDEIISSGSYFTDSDVESNRRVLVIGTTVATDLFGTANPIGKTINVGGTPFDVIGLLKTKGSSGFADADDVAIGPLTTIQGELAGYGSLSEIVVEAKSAKVTTAADDEITALLDTRHKVTTANPATFSILDQAQLLATSTSSAHTFTVLLGAVAAISLVVGGIGITNIMLVTVTERTREIGIRKAIGAPKRAILAQFLVEATILSVFGGLLGVLGGIGGSFFKIVGIKPVVVPASIFLAFGVSIVIGLFFGLYPANRAASLRPIDALRYE